MESPDTLKNPMVVEKHRMSGTGGGIPFRRAFPGDPVHVLNKEQCEAIMEFNDLKNKGSGLGTATVIMFAVLALLQARRRD